MVYICLNTMNGLRKISLKIFFSRALLILIVFIVTCVARAQHTPISNFDSALTKKIDTLKPRPAPQTSQPVTITSSDTIPGKGSPSDAKSGPGAPSDGSGKDSGASSGKSSAQSSLAPEVPGDPMGVVVKKLPNGLTLMLSESHEEPRIDCWITTRAGSAPQLTNRRARIPRKQGLPGRPRREEGRHVCHRRSAPR